MNRLFVNTVNVTGNSLNYISTDYLTVVLFLSCIIANVFLKILPHIKNKNTSQKDLQAIP